MKLSVAVLLPVTSITLYFFIQICASLGLVNIELAERCNLQSPQIEQFKAALKIEDQENVFPDYYGIPPASPVTGNSFPGTN